MAQLRLDPVSLWAYSALVYDVKGARRILNRLRFVLAALRARGEVRRILGSDLGTGLEGAIRKDGRVAGFMVWPYLNNAYGVTDRFRAVAAHQRLVCGALAWADLAPGQAMRLADLGDRLQGLAVELENAPWFVREGALNLSLMLKGERLISVSFSLRDTPNDMDAYVGSVQGNARVDVVETYKVLAEAMNDLRPRDLIFKLFRVFAAKVGVQRIYCVADSHHVQLHPYFGGKKVDTLKLKYDELWIDQGGVLQGDGFFVMPAIAGERPLSDVPIKKRGRYKRRLEMFGDIEARFARSIEAACSAKASAT